MLFLPPVLVAVRFCGRRAGLLLCLLAAAFWFLDSAFTFRAGRGGPPNWMLLERSAIFVFITVLVDALLAGAKRSGKLLANERRTSRSKSEMLTMVSHEINNSLAMIGLAVNELEIRAMNVENRDEICGIVKRNVSRMGVVARNFLSEARMAAGHLELSQAAVSLDRVVADVVGALKPLSDQKEIDVSVNVAPGLTATADRDALEVALTNLVGNAIKYTPERGRVSIEILLREGPPREATVSVADNGIGISPEDRARILAAFVRADEGKRRASGFGLGLKIAADIVKAHGGALAVESEPGKGSRFSFVLRA
jgi:two-component system sensor histidine kinase VicK